MYTETDPTQEKSHFYPTTRPPPLTVSLAVKIPFFDDFPMEMFIFSSQSETFSRPGKVVDVKWSAASPGLLIHLDRRLPACHRGTHLITRNVFFQIRLAH